MPKTFNRQRRNGEYMHFGLIPSPYHGHLNPMNTIGRKLKQRGHKVTVFGIEDVKDKIENEGLNFYPYGSLHLGKGEWKNKWLIKEAAAEGLAGLVNSAANLRKLVGMMCDDIPTGIKKCGIDFLLVDQVHFSGQSISQKSKTPFITVCCALDISEGDSFGTIPAPVVPIGQLAQSFWERLRNYLSFRFVDFIIYPALFRLRGYCKKWKIEKAKPMQKSFSQIGIICPMVKEFNLSIIHHDHFYYCGPYVDNSRFEPDIDFEICDSKPLIYVSLGTVKNRRIDIFEKIAEACSSFDAQLVISLGDWHQEREIPKLPGDPIVRHYVPQLRILERTSLTITHGGMNTVMESLKYGVPMIAIPFANDQPAVAARVKHSNTGEMIYPEKLSVPKLKASISKVLFEPKYKISAEKIKKSIQSSGGLNRAVEIIENLAVK